MAQATRTASRSSGSPSKVSHSDDPLENVTTWFQVNAKPVGIAVGGIALAVAAIFVFRATEATKRERASAALFAAQAPLADGNLAGAETELRRVIERYGGTTAGQQAVLLLAQVSFEQGKYADGIAALENAKGSANRELVASMESMIGAGHEAQGAHDQAAAAFGRAASATSVESDKARHEASQARALMTAGKTEEARAIWTRLAQLEDQPVHQEARVRLGEIAGAGGK